MPSALETQPLEATAATSSLTVCLRVLVLSWLPLLLPATEAAIVYIASLGSATREPDLERSYLLISPQETFVLEVL